MPEPTPTHPSADRNLLFGIVALQMDFIDRDALVTAPSMAKVVAPFSDSSQKRLS
jgi:hypothetical protein